jgi:hypothetical protein
MIGEPHGMVSVQAVIANDGRLLVNVEWPDGQTHLLDRDEAVALSLTMLSAAARLFPSASEFRKTIDYARGTIEHLHPAGLQ